MTMGWLFTVQAKKIAPLAFESHCNGKNKSVDSDRLSTVVSSRLDDGRPCDRAWDDHGIAASHIRPFRR